MHVPPVDPRKAAMEAEFKIKEKEQERDASLHLRDTSGNFQGKQPSRFASVLPQLITILLLVAGMVLLYYFLH